MEIALCLLWLQLCCSHIWALVGNPNCLLIVTPKGGHLGWVAGDEAPRGDPWTDPLMMDFLQNLECNAGSHTSSSNSSRPNENVHQSTDQMDPLKV
ncbi:hypothetical protein DCAR_0311972 [Daucus carota subsp. sativus]|uniref:Uncharacterized protein n=1 Tax=Daucus carota subsp. sativus TaxID=79200 RepID=A0AAF0WN53_DAUCS|nr:hypothetical protein DCAR_0311972 [Daucus carota subsp. sativus]